MAQKLRTAVLVVHGMGSQRPLETVRGVINAVWFADDDHASGGKRLWSHPEPSGVDIDLTVMTTSEIPGSGGRSADFHELYWAHLMSETRAVAVLLWLFELVRRGPQLRSAIKPLYWGSLIFLCLLCLSVGLLAIQFLFLFVAQVPRINDESFSLLNDSHSLVSVILVIAAVAAGLSFIASVFKAASKLAIGTFLIAALSILIFIMAHRHEEVTETLTNLLLPAGVAALLVKVTMGRWGLAGLAITLALSAVALWFVLIIFAEPHPDPWWWPKFSEAYCKGWIPWSISSFWSSLAAWFFIAVYLAMYGAFLQPFLGDAARYFRDSPANVAVRREIRKQSVETLDALHKSGDYDRIVVVAHSLGTVVAYDMLRAYYSRINQLLPPIKSLGPNFAAVDGGGLGKSEARENGREIIRYMHSAVAAKRPTNEAASSQQIDTSARAWLVTDFVTLGSPLTHAYYLMCNGKSACELIDDFDRRTREREFPTCPPRQLDNDGRLTFTEGGNHYFHHSGLFALTRWTNLYFKANQLFWGDAVGGPVGEVFRDPGNVETTTSAINNVADIRVYTNSSKAVTFFEHVKYWTIDSEEKHKAPHIVALRQAIDLADIGLANGLGD